MIRKITVTSVLVAAGFLSLAASAATLSVSPGVSNVTPGGTVVLTISGSEFTNLTFGGDFSVNWNPSVLSFVSVTVSHPPWDTSSVDSTSTGTGLLDRVDVFTFIGTPAGPDFDVAELTFNVVGSVGTSSAVNLTSSIVGWFQPDGSTPYSVTYGNATVNVVPIPPAALLFPIGFAAAARWARRRKPL